MLDDERMIDTMIAWIGAMSSSTFRAFRHTATTFILMMMGQIARLNQEARKQFELVSKMRDAEKAKSDSSRVKSLNEKVRQANTKRQTLDRYHKELDEAVFIHRYRDSDPTIRADCMEELGRWMRICPAQFLNNNYLRYFAWELSDESPVVRSVVVQALSGLYARQASSSALESFSERLLTRMVEIATGDVDTGVRIAMINTLLYIDQAMSIDDEEARTRLASHIFDTDAKVRAAVARFVANMIEEKVTAEDEDADKIRLKTMGELLARLNAQLGGEEIEAINSHLIPLEGASSESRISLATSALWTASENLRDWKPLVELLVLDHSGQKKSASRGANKKRSGAAAAGSPPAREEYRLEPAEEAILVEYLVVMLQKSQEAASQSTGKGQFDTVEETLAEAMTKDLIPVLPKMFNKYKTESSRIVDILTLIKHMKLLLYLEYQQTTAYEALWDQVTDQFQRHTEAEVITRSVEAIASMAATTGMSNINEIKLHALRESTVGSLKEAVPSFAQLSGSRSLLHDDSHRLTACTTRLKFLFRLVDLTVDFDDSEDERSGGAWDILLACAQRFSLERLEEAEMVENAIVTLALYVIWKTNALVKMEDGHGKATQAESLLTKRQAFLSLCERMLESASSDVFQAAKKQAFRYLLDVHIMYANMSAIDEDRVMLHAEASRKLPEALHLTCGNTTQDILATFTMHETKRFYEKMHRREGTSRRNEEDDEESRLTHSLSFLREQHDFVSVISHYMGAIRLGMIDIERSATLLAYYGRLGRLYDACLRTLVEAVREMGINQHRPAVACKVLLNTLVSAFEFSLADPETEGTFVNLAKTLSSCLVVRGPQLAIVHGMDSTAVIKLHERLIEWSISQVQETDRIGLRGLTMFKALAQLLISVKPREALTIKSDMDRILSARNVEVPSASKDWDPLRNYEKRLVMVASKSDAVARQISTSAQKQQQQQPKQPERRQRAEEDADEDDDADINASVLTSSPTTSQRSRPRPRPQPPRSTQDSAAVQGLTLTQQEEDDVDSILGRGRGGLNDLDEDVGMTSAAFSLPAFDLSQDASETEASQRLFRGTLADESQSLTQTRSSTRPTRRARPSRSFAEDDSDDEASSSRRKRTRHG